MYSCNQFSAQVLQVATPENLNDYIDQYLKRLYRSIFEVIFHLRDSQLFELFLKAYVRKLCSNKKLPPKHRLSLLYITPKNRF